MRKYIEDKLFHRLLDKAKPETQKKEEEKKDEEDTSADEDSFLM